MGSGVSTSDAEALAKVKADLIVAEAEAAWLLQVVEKLKSHSYLLKLWQKCNFKNLSYITLKQVQHLILFNKLWAFPRLKDARCLRCFFTQHCNSGSAAPASGISDSRRPSFSTLRSDAHWLRLGFSKLRVQWPCFPMLIRDIVIHGVLLRRQRNEYKRLATGQHGKAAAQMSKDSLKQFLNLLNIAPASQFKVFEQLATLAETGSGLFTLISRVQASTGQSIWTSAQPHHALFICPLHIKIMWIFVSITMGVRCGEYNSYLALYICHLSYRSDLFLFFLPKRIP